MWGVNGSVQPGLTNRTVWSLAVSGTNLFAGTFGGCVFLSTNNGATWNAVNSGFLDPSVYVYSLAVDNTNLYAGTTRGVYVSGNNGTKSTVVNTGLSSAGIYTGQTGAGAYSLVVSGSNLFAGQADGTV